MKMGAQLVAVGDLNVGVWLHTASDPPADEWSSSCRNVADFAKDNRGDFTTFRALIVTDGGTPDALQRKELFGDALRGYPVKTAVITEAIATNALKRGIATALSWMNPNFRVFEPTDLGAALEHIGLDRARFDSIWTCLTSLQASLESNVTMGRLAALNRVVLSLAVPRLLSEPPRASGVLRAVKAHTDDSAQQDPGGVGGQRATERSDSSRARKG
jgi:hypothetical protein